MKKFPTIWNYQERIFAAIKNCLDIPQFNFLKTAREEKRAIHQIPALLSFYRRCFMAKLTPSNWQGSQSSAIFAQIAQEMNISVEGCRSAFGRVCLSPLEIKTRFLLLWQKASDSEDFCPDLYAHHISKNMYDAFYSSLKIRCQNHYNCSRFFMHTLWPL